MASHSFQHGTHEACGIRFLLAAPILSFAIAKLSSYALDVLPFF